MLIHIFKMATDLCVRSSRHFCRCTSPAAMMTCSPFSWIIISTHGSDWLSSRSPRSSFLMSPYSEDTQASEEARNGAEYFRSPLLSIRPLSKYCVPFRCVAWFVISTAPKQVVRDCRQYWSNLHTRIERGSERTVRVDGKMAMEGVRGSKVCSGAPRS